MLDKKYVSVIEIMVLKKNRKMLRFVEKEK
jgi:hypothetical protein